MTNDPLVNDESASDATPVTLDGAAIITPATTISGGTIAGGTISGGTTSMSGRLTIGWRVATGVVWGLVLAGFVAVWKTSRELGLNTWWLGPWGEPQPAYVTMVPFLAPLAMIVLTVNNVRWLPYAGLGAAAATAVIGVFDIARVPRLAIVELMIAAAGALTSIAGFAGRYRDVGAVVDAPVASPGDD